MIIIMHRNSNFEAICTRSTYCHPSPVGSLERRCCTDFVILIKMKLIDYSVYWTSTSGFLKCSVNVSFGCLLLCKTFSENPAAKFATILTIVKRKHHQFSFGASFIISEVTAAYIQRPINHYSYRMYK